MACYLITYDLRNRRDYDALYTAIKTYGTYNRVLESTWAVVTTDTAKQIADHLRKSMDSDDGIFVVKSGGEAAWASVSGSDDWLKKNV